MVRFFEPSLIVRNIRVDRKDVDVLGIIRLKPGQQADIYKVVNENAVNLEALILDGMSIPNGDLYKEVALKGSLEIVSMSLPSSHYVNLADFQTLSPASAGKVLTANSSNEFDWVTPVGADASALHVDEAGEIGGLSEKVTPVGADVLVIEDSADGGSKKKIQIDNLPSAGGGGDGYAYADPPNPTNGEWFQLDSDDFSWYYDAFAAGGSYITNSSGGSTSRPSGESGVSMPIQLNTGSTSSSYHAFSSQGGTVLGSSRFNLKYDVMFKIDPNIASGTVDYRYRIGWMDDIRHGGTLYCGVYLAMARAKNTTNFVGITLDQGSETVTNLGVAFTANTWYRMRISVDADAGNVNFAIAPRGSALPAGSNVTTNIPVATSFPLFRGFECSKVSGTGARTLRLSDWQLYASAA